ncbi:MULTISPECIES: toll/interleukin-1 receptor domain-containing protein [unclassified Duganella]|jgi:hypothetical protein|uniref:toll/interleukin-1 receptor domain-containing protein n=1 Tax=unclassified Duganella TaxID=2636909 RepID=UPI0008809819|nr:MULTISPECIES: toll/interleukin-1 receptor domain-containing protein [unclassified Duganella]SDG83337.1 TIR domain-containing protein [Duganella sp. OV458]SDK10726.1 TIR domain-containing protein [Duganella sp. OV510]
MAFYELAILGKATPEIVAELRQQLVDKLAELNFKLDDDVSLFVGDPDGFTPSGERCSAALCFAVDAEHEESVKRLMGRGIPVIPVAVGKGFEGFPASIAALNGMFWDKAGVRTVVMALLECVTLLPRQRRVFISYRRDESTEAALQLYAELSARQFDVFLDTHDIQPGKHFQDMLWQRLCDCDVLLFLDTQKYFDSRWTDAEFGRATWRGIPLVRAAWPSVQLNPRAQLATSVQLDAPDFPAQPGQLSGLAIKRICDSVEDVRTQSVTTRFQLLISTLKASVERGQGKLEGLSLRRSLTVTTPTGKRIAVYPSLGVPTSYTLFDATRGDHAPPSAVVYDDTGVEEQEWKDHMDWISSHVKGAVRLISSYKAGWHFSDWN